jgi:hypothetical protein
MPARTTTSPASALSNAATPWGPALVLERFALPQRAGEKRFSSVVELLESERGERLLRFAYTTDGVARRGPVTLRARDLERLGAELARHPAIAELFASVREVDA